MEPEVITITPPTDARELAWEAAESLVLFAEAGRKLCVELGTKELRYVTSSRAVEVRLTVNEKGHVAAFIG